MLAMWINLILMLPTFQSKMLEIIPLESVLPENEKGLRRMTYDTSSRLGDICGEVNEYTMKICGGGYICKGGYPAKSVCIHSTIIKKDGSKIDGSEDEDDLVFLEGCEAKFEQMKEAKNRPRCNPHDKTLFLTHQNRCLGLINRFPCTFEVDPITGIEI